MKEEMQNEAVNIAISVIYNPYFSLIESVLVRGYDLTISLYLLYSMKLYFL